MTSDRFQIEPDVVSDLIAELEGLFRPLQGFVRAEAQDDWQYLFAVIDLPAHVKIQDVWDLRNKATALLDTKLEPRAGEPRWMISFHSGGETLYAVDGGVAR